MKIHPNPSNMCVNCVRSQVDITEGIPKQVGCCCYCCYYYCCSSFSFFFFPFLSFFSNFPSTNPSPPLPSFSQVMIPWCKGCGRYSQPPTAWIVAALESRELLAYCLKRVRVCWLLFVGCYCCCCCCCCCSFVPLFLCFFISLFLYFFICFFVYFFFISLFLSLTSLPQNLNKVRLVDAGFIYTEPHSKVGGGKKEGGREGGREREGEGKRGGGEEGREKRWGVGGEEEGKKLTLYNRGLR